MGYLGALAAAAMTLAPLPPMPQNGSPPSPSPSTLDPEDPPAVVRTGPAADDRVTIAVDIDGKGPWHFVIDTGSQRTVISQALADRLALPTKDRVTILSMTGAADVGTVALPQIRFGSSRINDIQAPVLNEEDLGAPGLLGLDGLHAKRLLLNFRTGRMEISASNARARIESDAIVVEARRRKGQLILLDSQVEGSAVNIVLDTGTNFSIGNLALMRKLIKKGRASLLQEASATSVTGGVLTGLVGRIGTLRMGAVTLKDVPVLFADASPFEELGLHDKPALLLGINALRAFDRVAIDFGRGKVDFLLPDEGALATTQLAALPVAAADF